MTGGSPGGIRPIRGFRRAARSLAAAGFVLTGTVAFAFPTDAPQGAPASDEAQKLRADPSILLDGNPFPALAEVETAFPVPRRILYVSAEAKEEGDGSEARPWKDLARAVCRLEPGDRLVILPGPYTAALSISDGCRAGTAEAPIQVFGEEAFLHAAEGSVGVTATLPFWQFYHLQIVLGRPGSRGFATSGPRATDILFDRGHVYEGNGAAILVGAGSARVRITNTHVHQSGGVRIEPGAKDVTLAGNKIHHNFAGALAVTGGAPGARVENLVVTGNKFHNDLGAALSLSQCRDVRFLGNKVYNSRPADAFTGEAISVAEDCSEVAIEGNHFAEASLAIRVGAAGGKGAGTPPKGIRIRRNYFENRLTSDAVAVALVSGGGVDIFSNTFDQYAVGIRSDASPPALSGVRIANNLFIDCATLALQLADMSAVSDLGSNAFGTREGKTRVQLGATTADVRDESARAAMPGSRSGVDVRILSRDLANVTGIAVRDAGRPFDGLPYTGAAPDIGVAEK